AGGSRPGHREEVVVVDELLLVGEVLDARGHPLELLALEAEADAAQPRLDRVLARVLAQGEPPLLPAPARRGHDLVRERVGEDSVLVDPRLVGEGVAAHDRLVRLRPDAGDVGEHRARGVEELAPDTRREAGAPPPALPRHPDLPERGVARALADTVDRALDLARAR